MARNVAIIMYHYVRELKDSRYPEIKGISTDLFRKQLEYIMEQHYVIKMEDLITCIKSSSQLPENALLLTFDDAYIDHFKCVFPILTELGIQGSFVPPSKAINKGIVLDVNKVHFILAAVANKGKLIDEIYSMLDAFRSEYSLKDNQHYFQKLATTGRFDPKEVVFIKRLLQSELPEKLRQETLTQLFNKYVTKDEKAFSKELYMNIGQLTHMREKGMYIGSHASSHSWLDTLDEEAQEKEIDLSLELLKEIGSNTNEWVISYPYGAYNDSLLTTLKRKGCLIGLTTKFGIADLDTDNPLTLPRLDTNDLSKK